MSSRLGTPGRAESRTDCAAPAAAGSGGRPVVALLVGSCSSSPLPSHLSNRSWWWTNLIERLHHCQMAAHGEPAIAKSFNAEFVAAQTTGSLKECWTSRHM